MKAVIVFIAYIMWNSCMAQSWVPLHSFSNNTYSLLCGSSTQQLAVSDTLQIAIASDYTNWTEHGVASIPAHLFDTSLGGTNIKPLEIAEIPDGYLLIVLKTEYSAMGNLRFRTLISLKSPDGITWSNDATIDSYTKKVREHSICQVGDKTIFMYGDEPDGWISGWFTSDCRLFSFSWQLNTWSETFQTTAHPSKYYLFSDDNTFYFMHGNYAEFTYDDELNQTMIDPGYVEISSNATEWLSILGPTQYLSSADACNQQIFGAEAHYSTGASWQVNSNTSLSSIHYNGDTVVGVTDTHLVVSSDFGSSWNATPITSPDQIFIVEHTNQFIALVTERFISGLYSSNELKTSIFAVESRAMRNLQTNTITLHAPSTMSLDFKTESNVVYQIENTYDLVHPEWLPYGLPLLGGESQSSSPVYPTSYEQIFFRVVTPAK